MFKAFVIRDDKGKFKDLEDVLRIARAEGKKYFRVKENVVKVLRVWGPDPLFGYVVLVEGPEENKKNVPRGTSYVRRVGSFLNESRENMV